jgi:hypothetical protein
MEDNIPEQIIKIAFDLNQQLLKSISNKNLISLNKQFNISSPIFEEIEDELISVNLNTTKLTVESSNFEVFKYNDSNNYGIEASIFTIDGKITDLTINTELIVQESNQYYLNYRLIEIM